MNTKIPFFPLERLLSQAQKGNKISFSKIVVATLGAQYYLACDMLHNSDLAQAVVEAAYIAFYKSIHGMEHSGAITSYLSRVNYYFCVKIRNNDYDDLEARFTHNKDTPDISLNGDDAFSKLPYTLRAILILRFLSGLSIQNTAFIMGLSPKTIRELLKKAFKRLDTTPYKFNSTIQNSMEQASIPTYDILQRILKSTHNSSMVLNMELLKPTSKLDKRIYMIGAASILVILLISSILLFRPKPSDTPDKKPIETAKSTPNETPVKTTTDLVPPSIKDLRFSDDGNQVSFTIHDDIGIDTSRISILENGTKSIKYTLTDNQIRFSMPDSPVMVYLYDLDGNETHQTIKQK